MIYKQLLIFNCCILEETTELPEDISNDLPTENPLEGVDIEVKQNQDLKINFSVKMNYCYSLQFLSELNNVFHMKDFNRYTCYVKLIDNRRNTKQEKY